MDTDFRYGTIRRTAPGLPGRRHLDDRRDVPKRVIRAFEEILLLAECWKQPDHSRRRLH